MLSSKIRTTLVVLTATAAATVPAVSATTSVAAAVKKPVIVLTHVHPVTVKPIVADHKAMEVGSAGVEGYDDATCQGLLNDYNTAVNSTEQALLHGEDASSTGELANRIYGQMTDNCLVVDAS